MPNMLSVGGCSSAVRSNCATSEYTRAYYRTEHPNNSRGELLCFKISLIHYSYRNRMTLETGPLTVTPTMPTTNVVG